MNLPPIGAGTSLWADTIQKNPRLIEQLIPTLVHEPEFFEIFRGLLENAETTSKDKQLTPLIPFTENASACRL